MIADSDVAAAALQHVVEVFGTAIPIAVGLCTQHYPKAARERLDASAATEALCALLPRARRNIFDISRSLRNSSSSSRPAKLF